MYVLILAAKLAFHQAVWHYFEHGFVIIYALIHLQTPRAP